MTGSLDVNSGRFSWYSEGMVAMKEKEIRSRGTEERALREVEGYVERMRQETEKERVVEEVKKESVEKVKVKDDKGGVILQGQLGDTGNIVLPLDEEEVKKKSRYGVGKAMRWLIERCIYLIKKYPGKVFYKSSSAKEG